MSVGKAEQGSDAIRGRWMAAKQTPWTIILECSCGQYRKTGVVTFQLVERSDERLRVSGQFERRRIRIQLAGAGQCQTKQLTDRRSGAQQCGRLAAMPPFSARSSARPANDVR
jgi:hypothetical protein